MSKKQYIVTPQVERDIRAAANELPPIQKLTNQGARMWRLVTIPTLGKDIPLHARKAGDGVKPDEMYNFRTREPILLEHYTELINRYKAGGEEAVEQYCRDILKILNINFKPKGD